MEYDEMKDRIAHIIRAKNLTAADFASKLGIQPSNISHLLAGRNNPSLDFVRKLKETFPEYSLDWIVLGIGPVTVSEPIGSSSSYVADSLFASAETPVSVENPAPKPQQTSGLKKMIWVYEDNTFEVLLPR